MSCRGWTDLIVRKYSKSRSNLVIFHDEFGTPSGKGILIHTFCLIPRDNYSVILRKIAEIRQETGCNKHVKWNRLSTSRCRDRDREFIRLLLRWWPTEGYELFAVYSMIIDKDKSTFVSNNYDSPDYIYNYTCFGSLNAAIKYCKNIVPNTERLIIQFVSDWRNHSQTAGFSNYLAHKIMRMSFSDARQANLRNPPIMVGRKNKSRPLYDKIGLLDLLLIPDLFAGMAGASRDVSPPNNPFKAELCSRYRELAEQTRRYNPSRFAMFKRYITDADYNFNSNSTNIIFPSWAGM